MMFLAILIAGLITSLVGVAFRRILGWPTTFADSLKWGYGLLAVSLLYSALPQAIGAVTSAGSGPTLPSVNLGDAFPALLVIGLAVLGYVGWTRGEFAREEQTRREARAVEQPRHREMPPPPARSGGAGGSFLPRGAGRDPLFDDEA